ncbi:MAG: uroporphyrinogen-III synthase, partial [Nitrospinota bacterium]
RLAAVGGERRSAVEAYGLQVEVTPARASTRALLMALAEAAGDVAGLDGLVVSGEPPGSLSEGLADLGAAVTLVQSARRTLSLERRGEVAGLLAAGKLTGVVFLTSGGVARLRRALEADASLAVLIPRVPAYAMSPRTAEQAKALGFQDLRHPATPSREALVETICAEVGR